MLQVGQTLWFEGAHRHNAGLSEVTVTKVGRKWAQLSNHERIDVQTLYADGGQYVSPGRCWLSKVECDAEANRQAAWSDLVKMIQHAYRAPEGVSEVNIRRAISLLKSE